MIETALGAELSDHLGYPPGQAPPGGAGNVRNGSTPKTVQTELGPVQVKTPRDRVGTFEPKLVGKRQTGLAGLDEKILGLYAGGMSVRDIETHLGETLRRRDQARHHLARDRRGPAGRRRAAHPAAGRGVPDRLVRRVAGQGPRGPLGPLARLAIGATVDGEREVLGIWWQETEGAKFWLAVLNDLHQCGVRDVLVACVDGLTGFPEAIEAVFPQAWVQICIVHFESRHAGPSRCNVRESDHVSAFPRARATA